ncbi:MAG: hypothetical protein NVS3B14_00390 [Ktedonobacteraceae bacterium]
MLDRDKHACCYSLDLAPFSHSTGKRGTLLINLCRDTLTTLLWPGRCSLALIEHAFPGSEERIIYDSGDGQIEKLHGAFSKVTPASYEATDSDGYGKWLPFLNKDIQIRHGIAAG